MYIVKKIGDKFGVVDEENNGKIYEFTTLDFASSCVKTFNYVPPENSLTTYGLYSINYSSSKLEFGLRIGFDISWFAALLIALSTDKIWNEKVDVIRAKINQIKKLYNKLMWGWYK